MDALPSFAALSRTAKIGLSKWIFYVKKSGPIFDEKAKLGNTIWNTYDLGGWLILLANLKNWVAEGVAFEVKDFNVNPWLKSLLIEIGNESESSPFNQCALQF